MHIGLDVYPFQSYVRLIQRNSRIRRLCRIQRNSINNSGFKAKSAQKQGKNGLFSCFGKFASTIFQENGDFVHRNSIMQGYLETTDGALSVPDVAISRSFPQIFPYLGITVFFSYAGFDLFLELRWTRHATRSLNFFP